jgi:eukaryotic-like serine/threonine-protein kinase
LAFATPEGTQFVRLLGGGSVFQVSLVRARERELVCKRLAPHALETHEGRAAMVREARLLSVVDHHALPRLVRVGNDAYGPFFLETYVPGTSLRDLLQGWSTKDKPVPLTLVRHVTVMAFETLAELHELKDDKGPLGIVHGDISPDHVLLGPLGDIGLIDLGAARFRELEPEVETNDRGTVPYAAPELVRGEDKPGQTTDLYALCATLLWFATGEPLCDASTDAAMLAEVATRGIRRDLAFRATAFSPEERECLHAALDPDRTGRPSSARQLLDAFLRSGPQRDIPVEAR